jgi:hypothetical protein
MVRRESLRLRSVVAHMKQRGFDLTFVMIPRICKLSGFTTSLNNDGVGGRGESLIRLFRV